MTAMTNTKTKQVSVWGHRLVATSSRVAAFFATRTFRFLIVLMFLALSLYISYRHVWQPLISSAPLPPGVGERMPQLNAELLNQINTQRLQRVEASPLSVPRVDLFQSVTHTP